MVKKELGVGAVCRVLVKYLHPSEKMRAKFPNRIDQLRLGELVAIRQELKTVNRSEQMCVVMRHDFWPDEEIYCVKRWVKVVEEGHHNDFFHDRPCASADNTENIAQANTHNDKGEPIPDHVFI